MSAVTSRTITIPFRGQSTRRSRRTTGHTLVVIGLSAWTLFTLAPIVWILLMSFKTPDQIVSNPPLFFFAPTFENYLEVFSGSAFLQPFMNSLIVTGGALVVTLVIGLPTAYALARFRFRGREDIGFGILSLRFAPELLIILPLYLIFQNSGLANSYVGLILAYQIVTLPMLVWMLRSFIEDLPGELEEAVAVDGGTRWT
ncbi:MAG: carbohydrate ABC transporter permease, partial [Microbacterium sp.]